MFFHKTWVNLNLTLKGLMLRFSLTMIKRKPMDLKNHIREIQDFPKPGINFKDITTLLKDPEAFGYAVGAFEARYKPMKLSYVAGIESRGFLFAPVLAHALGCGVLLIRKKGKLPADTFSHTYQLEYGEDTLEIHQDSCQSGDKVVLIDDLLATGGTAKAAATLLEQAGASVEEIAFLIELNFLQGRNQLDKFKVFSQIQYH